MKKILIAGAHSYIGDSVKDYLNKEPDKYQVSILDTIGYSPNPGDFKNYDVVFCVTGIAHIKETKKNRHLYYEVNRDLVVGIARAAKEGGVRQFILLSSMSVYGMITGHITKETIPNPKTAYGKSKLEADIEISKLADDTFAFACLRPPMVYGNGCKGNYQSLRKLALKSPIFPSYENKRSMVFIGNLCEYVKLCIDDSRCGLFFPQNSEYTNTCSMVNQIAQEHGRTIRLTVVLNWAIRISPFGIVKKVFGNLTYEKTDLVSQYGFEDSIRMTEE